ncbi:MAG: TlpA family protein disulfide reductase [Chloroflexi bacterium]|nr:TlpA family protein disulfide reductase [Chloroflexota bacterium]
MKRERTGLRVFALTGAVVATVLVLAACTTSATQQKPASPPAPPNNNGFQVAPDFQITVYQGEGFQPGQKVKLSDLLAQGKPVVLNMFAGRCPPCRLEMPDLQAANEEFKDDVLLFGLDVGPFTGLGSREDGRALLRELNVTYSTGTTFDGSIIRSYRVRGMPTTIFITPQGQIVQTWTGLLTKAKLIELVGNLRVASRTS